MAIKIPKAVTLAKYGLTADEWSAILRSQGDVCPICEKQPDSGLFVTDHFHTTGWKKLPPEERKLYVRGILCWWCNKTHLGRGVSIPKLRNAIIYLEKYQDKKPQPKAKRKKSS